MADQSTDPHDDQVKSVPLPTDEPGGERVIAQQNQGAEGSLGGGEWPSTETAPTGPAPGTAAVVDAELPEDGAGEGSPSVKDVLESDPVAAGAGSVPTDDEDQDSGPTRFS